MTNHNGKTAYFIGTEGKVGHISNSGKSYWFRPNGCTFSFTVEKDELDIQEDKSWVEYAQEGQTIKAIQELRKFVVDSQGNCIGLAHAKHVVDSIPRNT